MSLQAEGQLATSCGCVVVSGAALHGVQGSWEGAEHFTWARQAPPQLPFGTSSTAGLCGHTSGVEAEAR